MSAKGWKEASVPSGFGVHLREVDRQPGVRSWDAHSGYNGLDLAVIEPFLFIDHVEDCGGGNVGNIHRARFEIEQTRRLIECSPDNDGLEFRFDLACRSAPIHLISLQHHIGCGLVEAIQEIATINGMPGHCSTSCPSLSERRLRNPSDEVGGIARSDGLAGEARVGKICVERRRGATH
jgi:hypothetical protein